MFQFIFDTYPNLENSKNSIYCLLIFIYLESCNEGTLHPDNFYGYVSFAVLEAGQTTSTICLGEDVVFTPG